MPRLRTAYTAGGQGRPEADDEYGGCGEADRCAVQRLLGPPKAWQERDPQRAAGKRGHDQRSYAGERGEHDALDNQQASHAPSSRAECIANGKLPSTGRDPHHQQVRHVGGRDQEHDQGRAAHDQGQVHLTRQRAGSAVPQ